MGYHCHGISYIYYMRFDIIDICLISYYERDIISLSWDIIVMGYK